MAATPRDFATGRRSTALGLLVAVLLVLASAAPAPAKLPPFQMSVSPRVVTAGSPVHVTVTMLDWSDPGRPDRSFNADDMTGLVGVVQAEHVDDGGRPTDGAHIRAVVLPGVGQGTYRGTITLARPGSYTFLAFPEVRERLPAGPSSPYPSPVEVTVVAHPPASQPADRSSTSPPPGSSTGGSC